MTETFRKLIVGLGLTPVNVKLGPEAPRDEAYRLMSKSAGVVAVATRGAQVVSGGYAMREAVHHEISMAIGLRLPLILFVEEGVNVEGFIPNSTSYRVFNREHLDEVLVDAVIGLSALKEKISGAIEPQPGPPGYHSERTLRLVALEEVPGGYTWRNVTTKRLRFDEPVGGRLKKRSWLRRRDGSSSLPASVEVDVTIEEATDGKFKVAWEAVRQSGESLEIIIDLIPDPLPGEFVELTTHLTSPEINWIDAAAPLRPEITIRRKDYEIVDGLVPIEQTRLLTQQWRFPRSYGLELKDLQPVVATFGLGIDFPNDDEMERVTVKKLSFGGHLVVQMEVENPLFKNLYGLAWNLPGSERRRPSTHSTEG